MTFWQAVVIGIVQGLTEFIPVSSTAHIKVIPTLLGWGDPGAAFTAVIQWGTLLAALFYFRRDIINICTGTLHGLAVGKPLLTPESRMGWMIILGTLPIVACGLLFKRSIETTLRSLYVITASAIGLALLLIVAEWLVTWRSRTHRRQKDMADIGWGDTILVGLAQAVALIPGASRSGVTITGGLFAGMKRDVAARFSFLLSLPAVFAAGVLELYQHRGVLLESRSSALNLLVATAVSAVLGYASIAFLLSFLRHRTTYVFITYRIVLGIVLLALLTKGVIKDDVPGQTGLEIAANTITTTP